MPNVTPNPLTEPVATWPDGPCPPWCAVDDNHLPAFGDCESTPARIASLRYGYTTAGSVTVRAYRNEETREDGVHVLLNDDDECGAELTQQQAAALVEALIAALALIVAEV